MAESSENARKSTTSRFVELPVYFRDQGGEKAKFTKLTSIWVGRDWTMRRVREFLVESKRADTKHLFDWLPERSRFPRNPFLSSALAIWFRVHSV